MKTPRKARTPPKKRPSKAKAAPWRSSRTFTVVVERDDEGFLVASVPTLPGCHTQARSYAELDANIREAIGLYLEVYPERGRDTNSSQFVAVQRVEI